jgi:hypothetical protein
MPRDAQDNNIRTLRKTRIAQIVQVKHIVENTSRPNLLLQLITVNPSSHLIAVAFDRFLVTLRMIMSSAIALISGSTLIGLGVPLW